MERAIYYVSVGTRTVQNEIPDSDYFTVEADEAELEQLRELLARLETADEATHAAAPIPFKSNDHAEPSDAYDEDLMNLYGYVYQIGTGKTKRFMEQMDLFEKLRTTDYDYPGYNR